MANDNTDALEALRSKVRFHRQTSLVWDNGIADGIEYAIDFLAAQQPEAGEAVCGCGKPDNAPIHGDCVEPYNCHDGKNAHHKPFQPAQPEAASEDALEVLAVEFEAQANQIQGRSDSKVAEAVSLTFARCAQRAREVAALRSEPACPHNRINTRTETCEKCGTPMVKSHGGRGPYEPAKSACDQWHSKRPTQTCDSYEKFPDICSVHEGKFQPADDSEGKCKHKTKQPLGNTGSGFKSVCTSCWTLLCVPAPDGEGSIDFTMRWYDPTKDKRP